MAGGKNTITQRIALDGGKEIEAELKALGAVGEEAFKRLKRAADDLKINPVQEQNISKFKQALDGLKKPIDDLRKGWQQHITENEKLGASWTKLTGGLSTFGSTMGIATVAITGAVAGFGLMAKAAADAGDALGESAQKAGIAVEQFETLSFAASTAGVGPDKLVGAIARLNKQLVSAKDAAKDLTNGFQPVKSIADRLKEGFGAAGVTVTRFGANAKDTDEKTLGLETALKRLGTSVTELKGMTPEQQMIKLADGFSKMEDGSLKTALALAVFGKSGAELIPFFNMGSKGISSLIDRMKALGLTLGEDGTQKLGALADEFDFFSLAISKLSQQIIAALGPALVQASDGFLQFIAQNRKAIVDFAAYIGTEAIGILRDFFAALNGGEVQRPWVQEWTQNIIAFGQAVQNVFTGVIIPAFNMFMAAADLVAKGINAIFGTNLNGAEVALIAVIGTISGAFAAMAGAIGVVTALLSSLFGIGTVAATAMAAAIAIVVAAIASIPGYSETAIASIATGWQNLTSTISGIWDDFIRYLDSSWVSLVAGFNTVVSTVTGIWTGFMQFLSSGWTALLNGPQTLANAIVSALTGAFNTVKSAWNEVVSFINSTISSVISAINSVISSIQSAISAAANLVGLGGGGGGSSGDQGFATGGYVRGPGSGTSDSIRAWLSNGEFVIQAAAVRKYGKDFLAALNAGRLKLPAFASGGLVSAPTFKQGLPAFASGGLVDGLSNMMAGMMPSMALPSVASVAAPAVNVGRPVNLTIGGETFAGLMAPEDVAKRLVRFAQGQAMRSAGRKPGWA